jgi:hypothetical protein
MFHRDDYVLVAPLSLDRVSVADLSDYNDVSVRKERLSILSSKANITDTDANVRSYVPQLYYAALHACMYDALALATRATFLCVTYLVIIAVLSYSQVCKRA